MGRILDASRANKEPLGLALVLIALYSLYNYEREATVALLLIFSVFVAFVYFYDFRAKAASSLLSARLEALGNSTNTLATSCAAGMSSIAFQRVDVVFDIKEYLLLGDLPPHLRPFLSVDRLIALDRLRLVMDGAIDALDLEGAQNPVDLSPILHWCNSLLNAIKDVENN